MEITEEDRLRILDDLVLGLDREDDEFTVRELAKKFRMMPVNLLQYFETNHIEYKRRKAIANGRRVYVYRITI